MSKAWPHASIGSIAKPIERLESPLSGKTYRQIGVRLWGQGAYERESIDGSETKYKTLNQVKAGDIIVNKIWARNGSVSIVSSELEGCYCSGEFPIFEPIPTQLDPQWFYWITKTRWFWERCDAQSRGTSGKNRIRPEKFMAIPIPLPPLAEQQRIVAKIERLAGKIEEARGLRKNSVEKAAMLFNHTATVLIDNAGWKTLPLGELLTESPRNGLSPKPEVETGGRPMLRINSVSSSPTRFVDMAAVKYIEVTDEEAKPFILQNNDIFLVRYNGDINRVAKPAIYKSIEGCTTTFPDKLIRLRPKLEKMLPDFLVFALNTTSIRQQVEKLGKTTAGNIGISGGNIKSFIVPVPPLFEQHRLISILDTLQKEINRLETIQTQITAELDAMLPSILDRAFKGEL